MPTEKSSLDYSKMLFPLGDVPHGTDLLYKFPKLSKIKEFNSYGSADRNKVIRYIMLVYDKGSPLIELYPDLKKRKEAAADEAGFERTKSSAKFKDNVYEIMEMKNDGINEMIFSFLVLQRSRLWVQIVTNEQIFDEYSRLLLKAVDGDDDKKILDAANVKSKLREECKAISSDLEAFYSELFGDNDDLKEVQKVKPISPETIMDQISKRG